MVLKAKPDAADSAPTSSQGGQQQLLSWWISGEARVFRMDIRLPSWAQRVRLQSEEVAKEVKKDAVNVMIIRICQPMRSRVLLTCL